jgi:ribosomal protein L28
MPNLQRVKALVDGEVRYIRVTANAIKKGLVVMAPKRTWKKDAVEAAKA